MLKTRTLFNVLGPLINSGASAAALIGVYSPETGAADCGKTLRVLGQRGGSWQGGMDEVCLCADRLSRSCMTAKLKS